MLDWRDADPAKDVKAVGWKKKQRSGKVTRQYRGDKAMAAEMGVDTNFSTKLALKAEVRKLIITPTCLKYIV